MKLQLSFLLFAAAATTVAANSIRGNSDEIERILKRSDGFRLTAGKGGKNIDLLRKPLNMNMCFEVKDIKKTEVCTAVMAEILLNNYQGLNVIVTENPDLQNCNDVIYVEKGKDCDEYLDEADFLLAETYTKSFGEYPGDLSYKCDIDHGKFKDEKDCKKDCDGLKFCEDECKCFDKCIGDLDQDGCGDRCERDCEKDAKDKLGDICKGRDVCKMSF